MMTILGFPLKGSCKKGKSIRTVLVYDGRLLPIVRADAYFDFTFDIVSFLA